MFKKAALFIVLAFLLANVYGCFLLLAGAAGGGGTAVWLSGKLSQDVNASFDRTIRASESALKALNLEETKKTIDNNVAQIMGKYYDGKTIWIDVRRITDSSTKVEVRVGGVSGDKTAADKILKKISSYL